ncbi:DUF58 domain-containing protein [Gilvimarinus sp. SDUM040013]|uniref:DUF58 domain-containing protein n=1 Tax=Gilvimarinus gilvus TaxID=3058038 RepID=A0ABU4RUW1_9GAMM|nr:DUF58 domain-containing protein [Gilvimarinus sp. SDUM040013]MDO3388478.1 DUF58 domain-containing protein [Gilvimarinus sp. SDUM040013]MDX6848650.1 DUF58 domain-containing protein [Gilvimarinus sp. SDUM040013]
MARSTLDSGAPDPRIYTSFAHLKGLQRQARRLSFLPRQRSKSVLAGRHSSRIRGRGLNFEELRDYRSGDDIRTIDWRVTARTGKAHVRVYAEEKDRASHVIVDQRMSMFFGSTHNMKSVAASEAATLCVYAILAKGDRVGAVVFNDSDVTSFKPGKSPAGTEQIIKCISDYNLRLNAQHLLPERSMSLNTPLQAAVEQVARDQLVVIISDFDDVDQSTEQYLGKLSQHNDVVLVLVRDPLAKQLPKNVQVAVSDGQSQMTLDTGNDRVHDKLQRALADRVGQLEAWRQKLNLTIVELSTADDTYEQIAQALAIRG